MISSADLGAITPLLLRTGGAGLGWWRIRNSGLSHSPHGLELHQAYRLFALGAALHVGRLKHAFEALRSAGVEAILGKGWAIARLYPSAGLRPYGDLDLYVRPEEHAPAAAALSESGAQDVDLHRGFAELDDRSPQELYRRSLVLDVDGVAVRVFGPEDHLRLLALHMLRHGVLRPLWLCDVALALESRPSGFDWDAFARGDPRRTQWAASALGLAHDLLGARLDGVPLAEASRLPAWLVLAVLREWGMGRAPQGSRTPMAHYVGHPNGVLRALVARWPNAVEATVGVGGSFSAWPRLPWQLAECARRSGRFAVALFHSLTARAPAG